MSRCLTESDPCPYQNRAVGWVLNRDDAVVCLPMRSGKTLVGCLWACDVLSDGMIGRVLVLEPSRFLVEQVHNYIGEVS